MKSKSFIIGSIIIFAIGLIFCLIHKNEGVINTLLIITGLLFLIPGVLNLLALLGRHKPNEKKPSGFSLMVSWVSTIAAIILGAMIVITPKSFESEFLFIVGALLILFALSLIYAMAVNLKAVNLPAWLYSLPGLVLIDGVILIAGMVKSPNTQTLLMGLGLMLTSVAFFVVMAFAAIHNRNQNKEMPQGNDSNLPVAPGSSANLPARNEGDAI